MTCLRELQLPSGGAGGTVGFVDPWGSPRGVKQNSEKEWQGWRGQAKEWYHHCKKILFQQSHYNDFKSCSNNTLSTCYVAFHVGNKVWVENMHILANVRPETCNKDRINISSIFFTIWVRTRGGGGSRQTVTNSDKGEWVKIGGRPVTYLLNCPLIEHISKIRALRAPTFV